MKTCEICNIEKELTFFNKSKKWWSKICKDCANEKRRKKYQVNNTPILEYCKKQYLEKKDLILQRNKKYRDKNKVFLSINKKQYVLNNKEKIAAYQKKYRAENKSKLSKNKLIWQNGKIKTDSLYKLKRSIRWLITDSVKNINHKKSKRTEDILGCSFDFFKNYIEGQFKKGMTWENHGKWHLDHIKPLSSGKTIEDVIVLNHYTNFQPLFKKENLSKSNKLVTKQLKLI